MRRKGHSKFCKKRVQIPKTLKKQMKQLYQEGKNRVKLNKCFKWAIFHAKLFTIVLTTRKMKKPSIKLVTERLTIYRGILNAKSLKFIVKNKIVRNKTVTAKN